MLHPFVAATVPTPFPHSEYGVRPLQMQTAGTHANMAKGSRSNSKKAVRAQRRSQPQTAWQEAADARRFAALAAATVSEPVGAVRDDGTIAEPPEPAPARPAKAAAESSAMQTDQVCVQGLYVCMRGCDEMANGCVQHL